MYSNSIIIRLCHHSKIYEMMMFMHFKFSPEWFYDINSCLLLCDGKKLKFLVEPFNNIVFLFWFIDRVLKLN